MSPIIIWISGAILYACFWFWYVGLSRKIEPQEIESTLQQMRTQADASNQQLQALRRFFEEDNGKDFVMVNLLELKDPKRESGKKLEAYQKVFLSNLLKRAGHPVFIARVATGKIENIGCDDDNWTAAGMVRYRSRRDLMEVIPETFGSEHHGLKLEALERTFAYPSTPWTLVGGPRIVVPLALALIASLLHLMVI
ncbi:MAG: hypothetical protein P8I38_13220 [Arenicella sp.]|jgi:hypothetical protein|nr:hypothetical protein [Arenicella sp.]